MREYQPGCTACMHAMYLVYRTKSSGPTALLLMLLAVLHTTASRWRDGNWLAAGLPDPIDWLGGVVAHLSGGRV